MITKKPTLGLTQNIFKKTEEKSKKSFLEIRINSKNLKGFMTKKDALNIIS
jgi:hypothetical protein